MPKGVFKKASVTADGVAVTGRGDFCGVTLDAGSVILYDSGAASGTKIMTVGAPGIFLPSDSWIPFETGVYVDLTTAAGVTVYYQ